MRLFAAFSINIPTASNNSRMVCSGVDTYCHARILIGLQQFRPHLHEINKIQYGCVAHCSSTLYYYYRHHHCNFDCVE